MGMVNQFNSYRNQLGNASYDEPMVYENLKNTPEGARLLATFEQQQEGLLKKPVAGGAGQFASTNDQVQQKEGLEGYLYG
jgi:hypothetical protein